MNYVTKEDHYYVLHRVENMTETISRHGFRMDNMSEDIYRMGRTLHAQMKTSNELADHFRTLLNQFKEVIQDLKDVRQKNADLTQKVTSLTKELEEHKRNHNNGDLSDF